MQYYAKILNNAATARHILPGTPSTASGRGLFPPGGFSGCAALGFARAAAAVLPAGHALPHMPFVS